MKQFLSKRASSRQPATAWESISPLSDYVFSFLFGDQRNIDILKGFLKSVLGLPEEEYQSLTIINPILKRLRKKDKLGIVDVLVRTTSGRLIQVEIQVNRFKWMRNRIIFYLAKLLWEQMKGGCNYDRIHEVIGVVICNHVMLPEEEWYVNEYELLNMKSGRAFTGLLKVITLELPKMPDKPDGKVWQWGKFLRSRSPEELEAVLKAAKREGDRGLEMAVAEVKKLGLGDRLRMIADYKEKARRDLWAIKETAREEGRQEGQQEGREEALLEMAGKLRDMGLPSEQIARVTGLSPEAIRRG